MWSRGLQACLAARSADVKDTLALCPFGFVETESVSPPMQGSMLLYKCLGITIDFWLRSLKSYLLHSRDFPAAVIMHCHS